MTWRIWSPVGSTSSSNASFETSFSSDAASALDVKEKWEQPPWAASFAREASAAWKALLSMQCGGSAEPRDFRGPLCFNVPADDVRHA
jgi:hypothetical protein